MKEVVIKLSPKDAELVFLNADGWSDAGACEGGLRPDEQEALNQLTEQIRAQIYTNKGKGKGKPKPAPDEDKGVPLRARLENALKKNTMWDFDSYMLTDILDEVMKVLEADKREAEVA